MTATTRRYRTLTATVEGERVVLHYIQLIDVYPAEDAAYRRCEATGTIVEFSGVDQLTGRTAHGRLTVGDLIDEATWIWTE